MKNVCLIDIDDTLGDLKNPMLYGLTKHTGKFIHWDEWKSFDIPSIYDITDQEFFDCCLKEDVISKVELHKESRGFLETLRELDAHIVLITARGWHPDGENVTRDWVENNNLDIDELIVIPEHGNKADVIKKFNNIVFAVDDRIRNCRDYMASDLVGRVFIYTAPWNSHMNHWNHVGGGFDYHYRVNNLNEIFEYSLPGLDIRGLNECTQRKLAVTG